MGNKLDWQTLLSDWRCAKPGSPAGPSAPETDRSAFEADYDRIVYSGAFRRLARKTQVHPLAPNDHTHNRLTHSIEVASVGRTLAHRLANFLIEREEMPKNRTANDIAYILQSACLVHDIGNPPFGHAGEHAIQEWVKKYHEIVFGPETWGISQGTKRDWRFFEGNAQGFRIAARGDNRPNAYLRLTYATLGAMIKYPWDCFDPRAEKEPGKFNVFSTEKHLFDAIAQHMNLVLPDGKFARHPLSFLSEAADDICYRIMDLEDAVELGILQEAKARTVFEKICGTEGSKKPLSIIRGEAIRALLDTCWDIFKADYANIMAGTRTKDLKADFPSEKDAAMKEVKLLYKDIFAQREKVATELGAYKALGRIIKALCVSAQNLAHEGDFGNTGFLSQRTLELAFGKDYATENQKQPYDWWLHQIMDYVSGLTDNYARQLSREIEGT